jgi:hypothetical protein
MPFVGYSVYWVLRVLEPAHHPSGDETLGVYVTGHPHLGNPKAPDGTDVERGAAA